MWRAIFFMAMAGLAACNTPVVPQAPPSGEVIAFGGGPGGPDDACFTCHGLKGEGDGAVPKLAGQSAGYLLKQLEDYAGRWRNEPSMSPVAARLSDADRLAVSVYYAGLKGLAPPAPDTAVTFGQLYSDGDPERGIAPCARCHGAAGEGGGLATPVLAGQKAVYVREQLLAWKDSRRRNDPRDMMGAIARRLSDSEIDALARDIEALP
jgi:cytochrome c553